MSKLTAAILRRPKNANAAREPCACCGGHSAITELHHVVPLSMCADRMSKGWLEEINVPMIWLCPNCHRYLHAVLRGLGRNDIAVYWEKLRPEISDEVWNFIFKTLRQAADILSSACGGTSNE